MKFNTSNLLQSVSSWEELRRFTSGALTNIAQILTSNVTFGDNIKCQIIDVTFSFGGDDKTIPHNLGVTPIGYILIKNDNNSATFRNGSATWTSSVISIYCNAAVTTNVTFIILGG